MSKHIKKSLSVFLSAVILIGIFVVMPISASAITQSEFDNKLNSLRSQYPNYSTWYGSFDGGSQCYGFARLVGYNVFGSYPSSWSRVYSISMLKRATSCNTEIQAATVIPYLLQMFRAIPLHLLTATVTAITAALRM